MQHFLTITTRKNFELSITQREVPAPAYNFCPGAVFTLVKTSFSKESFSATGLFFKICLSCLLILVDVASPMMTLFYKIISAHVQAFFNHFLPVGNSTWQFFWKYAVELKPKSLIRSCFLRSLLRLPI